MGGEVPQGDAGDAATVRASAEGEVDNVFDIKPPITGIDVNIDRSLGELPGGNYSLFHDVQGRRFSLGANVRF